VALCLRYVWGHLRVSEMCSSYLGFAIDGYAVVACMRFTRGRPEGTEIHLKCRRGIPEKVDVCAR
jgi:hypothetical protein